MLNLALYYSTSTTAFTAASTSSPGKRCSRAHVRPLHLQCRNDPKNFRFRFKKDNDFPLLWPIEYGYSSNCLLTMCVECWVYWTMLFNWQADRHLVVVYIFCQAASSHFFLMDLHILPTFSEKDHLDCPLPHQMGGKLSFRRVPSDNPIL